MRANGSGAAMTAAARIDATLHDKREVLALVADSEGLGYEAKLSCGHLVWVAVPQHEPMHCASCLDQLVGQIRRVQAHQEPR